MVVRHSFGDVDCFSSSPIVIKEAVDSATTVLSRLLTRWMFSLAPGRGLKV